MCGIAGIASINNHNEKSWLEKALDKIKHRGPDDHGTWWSLDSSVGLGHRRLSIIDLSPLGHQPMIFGDEELVIVFNGEIYNYLELKEKLYLSGYTFRSNSDTEVILSAYHHWGNDFVNHLNGMFALVIYDAKKRKIFCARDRAGEKPFFYMLAQGTLIFGSELKALMESSICSKRINHEALDCYLAMGYVPGERCILDGVQKLPPAHAMTFDCNTGELKKWRYWSIPNFIALNEDKVDENDLVEELAFLLEDAVKKQMIADVPLGVLLSGGVDSSLITAMAVKCGRKIQTFTVGFPNHGKYDERSYARLISNYFQTDHTELHASDVTHELLPSLAAQYDEPIIDSSMIPTFLVTQLIRQHCTVALGGDGGDELFGGYGHHNRLLALNESIDKIPKVIRKPMAYMADRFLPSGFKGKVWLQSLDQDLKNGLPLIASYFDERARENLISLNRINSAEKIRKSAIPINPDLLQRATRMDFMNYLPEDILVKVDRASMLNSLEVRAPMLDYRIIEFAFGKVPSRLKTSTIERKILLKKLTKKVLPEAFDANRKQGFGIPLGEWFRCGPWNAFMKEVLLDEGSDLFNRSEVNKLIKAHERGYNNTERLFGLLMFEQWRKTYKINWI